MYCFSLNSSQGVTFSKFMPTYVPLIEFARR